MKRLIAAGALIVGLTLGGVALSACYTGECVVLSPDEAGTPPTILYGGSCTEAYVISAQIPGSNVEPWTGNAARVPTGVYNHK